MKSKLTYQKAYNDLAKLVEEMKMKPCGWTHLPKKIKQANELIKSLQKNCELLKMKPMS
ncbi:MAG: hypothetical protein IPP29_13085 [Bacteroidetes bacterium]|nr:hypothetical protein [Bacteroidota bacterium]